MTNEKRTRDLSVSCPVTDHCTTSLLCRNGVGVDIFGVVRCLQTKNLVWEQRMPKNKEICVTPAQRESVVRLRTLLGQEGFLVCDVAPPYRRHELDFIVAHQVWLYQFVIVRPTPKGRLSVTPFSNKVIPHGLKNFVKATDLPVRIQWSGKLLRLLSGINGYKKYFA